MEIQKFLSRDIKGLFQGFAVDDCGGIRTVYLHHPEHLEQTAKEVIDDRLHEEIDGVEFCVDVDQGNLFP